MKLIRYVWALGLCLATLTAHGALLGRSAVTPGGTDYQAYYDTVLNITWLANANAAAGSAYDDAYVSGSITISTATDGKMTFPSAQAWIASLNAGSLLGANDWRLPSMDRNGDNTIVQCGPLNEVACRDNEYGYNNQFNGVQWLPCSLGGCSTGPFQNLQLDYYWSGTGVTGNPAQEWTFYFPMNEHYRATKTSTYLYAWAVRPGDIATVPVPGAAWLLGSGLVAFGVLGRPRRS